MTSSKSTFINHSNKKIAAITRMNLKNLIFASAVPFYRLWRSVFWCILTHRIICPFHPYFCFSSTFLLIMKVCVLMYVNTLNDMCFSPLFLYLLSYSFLLSSQTYICKQKHVLFLFILSLFLFSWSWCKCACAIAYGYVFFQESYEIKD
jgi:hypothetical protein